MSAVFVTATGTDIGKTYVTAGLIRALRQAGRPVRALKPVVSGFDATTAAASDPAVLLAALGRDAGMDAIAAISPWRFQAPLSPDMAARRERTSISFDALVDFCRAAMVEDGVLLIEGVGGVMVPLDDHHTVLDWMGALGVPVLLVCGSYLGTISHTLTAIDVLARRGLEPLAVVVNESAGSTVDLAETVATLGRFAGRKRLVAVPQGVTHEHSAFAQLAALEPFPR
jgi:dethiobiotin synthetase